MSTSESPLPPLPARPVGDDNDIVQPDLAPFKIGGPDSHDIADGLSQMLFQRQFESYASPHMNEMSDLFSVKSLSDSMIKQKIDKVVNSLDPSDDDAYNGFWKKFVSTDHNFLVTYSKNKKLEDQLLKGIPQKYRGLVYLKVFNIRYQLSKEKYTNLLHKAVKTDLKNTKNVEQINNGSVINAFKVFNFYNQEILDSNNVIDMINQSDDSSINYYQSNEFNNEFLINVGKIISMIPNLDDEEILYLFLKVNKSLINLNKDQLCYEILRSLEDHTPQVFLHISKQGIDIKKIIKQWIFKHFFMAAPDNEINEVLLKVLDFTIFQGFSFLCRLFTYLFTHQPEEILNLQGDRLVEYLTSDEFLKPLLNDAIFDDIIEIEPTIIKYENEYYLIHMNSLNSNNNELLNAQEVNKDLNHKIQQLHLEIDNIKTTHSDILSQSTEFELKVTEAQQENNKLIDTRNTLQVQLDSLTMKQNLQNTIKANKDFSQRNQELASQIDQLKKTIASKSEKLAKYT